MSEITRKAKRSTALVNILVSINIIVIYVFFNFLIQITNSINQCKPLGAKFGNGLVYPVYGCRT